jgi:hypothetical protein
VTYATFLAFGQHLPLLSAMFLMVVLNFGLLIPSSPGGLAYRALAEELLRGDGVSIPRAARGKD